MKIKLPFGAVLHIAIETKKSRVLQDINVFGTLKAFVNYKERHNCNFNEARKYFVKIGHWPKS